MLFRVFSGLVLGALFLVPQISWAEVQLYTLERGIDNPSPVADFKKFFQSLVDYKDDKNIVVYIHGRGKNPEKSFKKKSIPRVESHYKIRSLIINWPSWDGILGRPYEHAIESAQALSDIFRSLDEYRQHNQEALRGRKVTLLIHSMGTIILRMYIENFHSPGTYSSDLFNALVINAADVPLMGHARWMEKIDFSQNIYLTQNKKDLILFGSRAFFPEKKELQGPKLGVTLNVKEFVRRGDLAKNVNYLELTQLTFFGHRHFNMPSLFENDKTVALFKELLNGRPLSFPDQKIGLYGRMDKANVYFFHKKNRKPKRIKNLFQ